MNWENLGYYLSLAAGICMLIFIFFFGIFLSMYIITIILSFLAICSALLTGTRNRLLRILGSLLLICFSFLWWFMGVGGNFLPTHMFFFNLQQPLGWIIGFPTLLGTLGSALNIIGIICSNRVKKMGSNAGDITTFFGNKLYRLKFIVFLLL